MRIEDYALIGDTQTAALVGRDGSIDWLCLPRFDSPTCFAKLLGDGSHGYWRMGPAAGGRSIARRYRGDSLVLETTFRDGDGEVRVVDCMPVRADALDLVRLVQGVAGRVRVRSELVLRFDYGSAIPWVRRLDGDLLAIAGPDAVRLRTAVPTHGEGLTTVAEFDVAAGDEVAFDLT